MGAEALAADARASILLYCPDAAASARLHAAQAGTSFRLWTRCTLADGSMRLDTTSITQSVAAAQAVAVPYETPGVGTRVVLCAPRSSAA